MSRINYNTNQKELIMESIMNMDNDWAIKDIYNRLDGKVGLTTIYRFVEKLASNNKVRKIIGKNNTTYYCYLEECHFDNHFYLKCENCGRLEHIDCDCIKKLTNHILKKHDFTTNKEHIIINGICHNCR